MCVCHQLDKDSDTSKPPKTADQVKVNTKVQKVSAVVNNRLQKVNTIRPELVCILQKLLGNLSPPKKKKKTTQNLNANFLNYTSTQWTQNGFICKKF